MKPAYPLLPLVLLSLMLAACQGEKTAQKSSAEGEILPGSASDAMLPYDTLRSQPPLAPLPVATGRADAKAGASESDGPGAESSEAAVEASAPAAPAREAATPAAQ